MSKCKNGYTITLTHVLDTEETVVAKVLSSLSALCELGLFQRMRIWELLSATLILLYHPNTLIVKGSLFRSPHFQVILMLFFRALRDDFIR